MRFGDKRRSFSALVVSAKVVPNHGQPNLVQQHQIEGIYRFKDALRPLGSYAVGTAAASA